MYCTVFWCLPVVLLFFFLALLHNHCYPLHKMKSRLVISIWQGPGTVATKFRCFRRNSNPLQFIFSSSTRGKLLLPLREIGSKKAS